MSKVLLGGASGFVGNHLIKTFLKQSDHHLVVLSRNPTKASQKWENNNHSSSEHQKRVSFSHWDQLDHLAQSGSIHSVINLTGRSVFDHNWSDSEFKKELFSSRIDTSRKLIEFIKKYHQIKQTEDSYDESKIPVFVGTSAIGYYPSTGGKIENMDEFTFDEEYNGPAASNGLGELCKAVEDSIFEVKDQKGDNSIRKVVLRPPGVLGADGGPLREMLFPFFAGFKFYGGSGLQPFPYVHVDDLCSLYVHATENKQMEGVYNATSPEMINSKTFTNKLSDHIPVKLTRDIPFRFPIPSIVLEKVLGKDRSLLLTEGQYAVPKRTLESGFKFKYDDIDRTLEDLLKNKTVLGELKYNINKLKQ